MVHLSRVPSIQKRRERTDPDEKQKRTPVFVDGVLCHRTGPPRHRGKGVGQKAVFGGLFGEAYIMEVKNLNRSAVFVGFGGRIPAPITSINN
jgi:hypothetical protein